MDIPLRVYVMIQGISSNISGCTGIAMIFTVGGGLSHRVAETKSRRRQGRAEGMELTSRRCIWGRVSEVGVPLPSGMGSGEEAVPCLAGMFVFTRRA